MKKLILPFLLFLSSFAMAQYSNNWIDYSKTYYKFRITNDGLCRIPQSALAGVGLGATNADNYQLWRNGQEVRLYTSVSGAPLGTSDYVEFFGRANDGKVDSKLYKNPDFQLADKFSLFSDTAMYFLTVNNGANLRYATAANGTPSTGTPDAYFMRDENIYYKSQINPGYAEDAGELVYSSSFDDGEGWTSGNIAPGATFTQQLTNLNVYTAGPANGLTLRVNAFGNAPNNRRLKISLNGDSLYGIDMNRYISRKVLLNNLNLSLLSNPNSAGITVAAVFPGLPTTDRIVVGSLGITYPATFNFNNAKTFEFNLGPSTQGNYLLIDNFNTGNTAPVLYDVANGRRYLGDITTNPGKVRFVLPASTQASRSFILTSLEAGNISPVTTLTKKNFLDLTATANQGDYIIISNSALYNDGTGTNQVELYRSYRASAAGGGYNAKTLDIDELQDQFGYGIYHHPSSIREFALNATDNWTVKPKYIFLIGRGISYNYYPNQGTPVSFFQTNFVPTFGWPASDLLLTARPGQIAPVVPVGRLAAINGIEVKNYLQKMKEYELAQATPSPLIASKAWMKNFMHVAGGKTQSENDLFVYYMNGYRDIAVKPMMGAHVELFAKSTTASVELASNQRITELFGQGLGYLNYFGHSSATTFEFNLSNPNDYANAGKYPFFSASGCNAGDYYRYDPARLNGDLTQSEKYIMAQQRGSIGFLASTHFGIPQYLDNYNRGFYTLFSNTMYGNTVGNQMKKNIENLGLNPNLDFYSRMHLEENTLHGDPAMHINYSTKPDYAIEDQFIKISPDLISIADPSFKVKINWRNIGKATDDSIKVSVKRVLPNGSIQIVYDSLRLATRNEDSLQLTIPINQLTDKGQNQLIVELDDSYRVDELFETNNKVTKSFAIFEDELRPVYPYDYAIVTDPGVTFSASTANPLVYNRGYVMELDTTTLFNSPFKKTFNNSGTGGLVQFSAANTTYTNNTVYYWRTAMVPLNNGPYIWNNSSFTYLPTSTAGFNLQHYYQKLKTATSQIDLAPNRLWKFTEYTSAVKVINGVFPTASSQSSDFLVDIDGSGLIRSACGVGKIIINAINPAGMEPMFNNNPGLPGQYNSESPCGSGRELNFQYAANSVQGRELAKDFITNVVPAGYYIVIRNVYGADPANHYAAQWATDPSPSFYSTLSGAGFNNIDSFNTLRAFAFIYKKGDPSFTPVSKFSDGVYDKIDMRAFCPAIKPSGTITTPAFGPANAWNEFHWLGQAQEANSGDSIKFEIIGVNPAGSESVLYTVDSTMKDFNISAINATQYPYLKIKMYNQDKKAGTPYEFKFLRLNYVPVPEGAVAPALLYSMRDSVQAGEIIDFKLAFKNISNVKFDSLLKVKLTITNNANVTNPIQVLPRKALVAGDTLQVSYSFDTRELVGNNILSIDFNPDNAQREQFHFNNFLLKSFYVTGDKFNPSLDVTFDAVHILNRDIVSSNPQILVRLKDENRFIALKDTALLKVQVRFPDQTLRNYYFNSDTMRFIPAIPGSAENMASIEFNPYFKEDGEYEFLVSGRDESSNKAGNLDYKVVFNVINKPMISNLLNYPNPFTSSTAFVFTLTGSEIPQNMRIQILTVTGKVVREITQNELGPIHIGRNITEYKWDGTDMYGQKLANGVYIYRVITNLNGNKLDSYKASGDDTDKYFNKGYGKMYLMR